MIEESSKGEQMKRRLQEESGGVEGTRKVYTNEGSLKKDTGEGRGGVVTLCFDRGKGGREKKVGEGCGRVQEKKKKAPGHINSGGRKAKESCRKKGWGEKEEVLGGILWGGPRA